MFTEKDRIILRDLAKKVIEIAADPIMEKRKTMWKQHNSLKRVKPMVLVFPEGAWRELLPKSELLCESESAKKIEWELRSRIYHYNNIHDDKPIEKVWTVQKKIENTGWGIEPKYVNSKSSTGAWAFDPVINNADDLKKIKQPFITYNEKESFEAFDKVNDLFGDILDVRLEGMKHVSFHLMSIYCRLRGLEQVMLDMYDEPQMLHEAMSILEEGNKGIIRQLYEQNLFSLNNDETYHSSGGLGYTDELPKKDFNPDHIRPCDIWSSAEAQEMALVSPQMHYEFILQYEKRLLEDFGLNGYGCCEDLTNKLEYVTEISNIRRISISPWSDVKKCAEKLKNNYIFSWKPQPAHLVGDFNTDAIRSYIKSAFEDTKDCIIEIILKDTHTCENQPERFTKWSQIASELSAIF